MKEKKKRPLRRNSSKTCISHFIFQTFFVVVVVAAERVLWNLFLFSTWLISFVRIGFICKPEHDSTINIMLTGLISAHMLHDSKYSMFKLHFFVRVKTISKISQFWTFVCLEKQSNRIIRCCVNHRHSIIH